MNFYIILLLIDQKILVQSLGMPERSYSQKQFYICLLFGLLICFCFSLILHSKSVIKFISNK